MLFFFHTYNDEKTIILLLSLFRNATSALKYETKTTVRDREETACAMWAQKQSRPIVFDGITGGRQIYDRAT